MRCMKRNKQRIKYCLFKESVPIIVEEIDTGEKEVTYEQPVELYCSISANKGDSELNIFGNFNDYDKTIIVDDKNCPIDENTVLFIDIEPSYIDGTPQYNYIVKRVSKSLNFSAYAIARVR